MSMSDCESSLSVFETPNCNFSANPFNLAVMPLAPRPSKKLLSKRIFLDLANNHFAAPAFPSPRSKKAKTSSSAFIIRHEQSSSTEFRTSLIRLLNGESLQRLKEERAAAAAAAVSELYDDASVDTISDNEEAIQSAALLFPTSSSVSAGSRRASSYKEKESSSTGNHDTVVLGRRIQRRSSGIARCA